MSSTKMCIIPEGQEMTKEVMDLEAKGWTVDSTSKTANGGIILWMKPPPKKEESDTKKQ